MIRLTIDGKKVKGIKGQTILEIAKENGTEIPTLCHDERVKVYGSCGICVVEVEGSNKLLRSCATQAWDGMIVYTDSSRVRKSRKMTLELLLSDHTGDCRPPCFRACPAETDCQGYIGLIANGQYREAVALLKESYPLPCSIGLVCPHPCEDACRRNFVDEPLSIAALKAFVAQQDLKSDIPYLPEVKEPTGKTAAVIGSGPAGLTAAFFMAKEGHKVTIYEAMPEPGGMFRYGIPEYRLPKDILDQEINLIKRMGVEFKTNSRISADISLEYLREKYEVVFLGIGAWASTKIRCRGEESTGVIGGIDFLREVALKKPVTIGPRVAVVGGGNTAMDAARTAVRLGASEVTVLYRRTRAEMPAQDIEIMEAEEEGVKFSFLVAPIEIISEKDKVSAIKVQRMQLGEADSSGRRRPVPIPGEEEYIPVDTVIAAIGQQINMDGIEGVDLTPRGVIAADKQSYMTSITGVFAGGDAVTGPGIAIEAVAQGKNAAEAMIKYLNEDTVIAKKPFYMTKEVTEDDFRGYEKQKRINLNYILPEKRRTNFKLVSNFFSEEEAKKEASRCLECGCADIFECKLIEYANKYQVDPQRLEGEKHKYAAVEEHPFIIRDTNKCILCGLCVRICDEVMGATALGLVYRGFDTVIEPEFGLTLKETECISCGQCAAVCPTGALIEVKTTEKNVPLKLDQTSTTCSFCGLGCGQVVENHGNMVVKVKPEPGGLLCSSGRFGWEAFNSERIVQPLLRTDGKLQPVSWTDAIQFISENVKLQKNRFSNSSIAVFASPSFTAEEAETAASMAKDGLGTDRLGSFIYNAAEDLDKFWGTDLPDDRIADLTKADALITVGSFNNNHIAAIKVREAAKNGSQVIIISRETSLADDKASLKICPPENNTVIIKQILAALIQKGFVNKEYEGLEELRKGLQNIVISKEALEAADIYGNAEQAMIIIDGYSVSSSAVQDMAQIAAVSGHIDGTGNGIIVITPGGNISGIRKAGFNYSREKMLNELKDGAIKTVFILGEDPLGAAVVTENSLKNTELLVVSTPIMNPTAALADVVLPGSTPMETSGSYISSDGSKRYLNRVQVSPAGKDNIVIFNELKAALTAETGPGSDHNAEVFTSEIASSGLAEKDILFKEVNTTDVSLRKFKEKMILEGLK